MSDATPDVAPYTALTPGARVTLLAVDLGGARGTDGRPQRFRGGPIAAPAIGPSQVASS